MKKDLICKGGVYCNGKGRFRRVVDIGDFPSLEYQADHDCVLYVSGKSFYEASNAHDSSARRMTRTMFASWAKEKVVQ